MSTERVGTHSGVWTFENLHGQSNYKVWIKKLRNALSYEGWERILEEQEPSELAADSSSIADGQDDDGNPIFRRPKAAELAANKADIKEYRHFNRKGWSCMYNRIDEVLLLQIDDINSVYEAIVLLRLQYLDIGFTAKHTAGQKLITTTLSSCNNDVNGYVQAIYACMKDANSLECAFPEWWIVSCFIANLDGRYKEFTQRIALQKVLPTLETVSAELREVDRMQKREAETKAFRVQASRGAAAQKDDKKRSDEARKPSTEGHRVKDKDLICKACKAADKSYRHHHTKCWIAHPELRPDGSKSKDKGKRKRKDKDKEKDDDETSAKAAYVFQANAVDLASTPDFGYVSSAIALPNYIAEATEIAFAGAAATGTSTSTEDDWIVDSGSSHPMTPSKAEFITYSPLPNGMPVYIADGGKLNAVGKGTVALEGVLPDGTTLISNITDALHVPKLSTGLLSVNTLTDRGVDINFHDDECRIIAPDGNQFLHAVKHRGQYELQLARTTDSVTALAANHMSKYNDESLKLWHRRTGHLGMDDLKRLANIVDGIALTTASKPNNICGPCMTGRQTRKPSKQPQEPVTELLGCIDSDVGGPMTPLAIGGKKYFVLFTDRASGCCWGYLMAQKSDVYDIFKDHFKPLVETQSGRKIKRWRTDHGTEVENKAMDAYAKSQGIKWEPSATYSPEQNGVSERQNRTVVEKIRAMLADAGLPPYMWGEMLFTSVYLRNRSPATRLRIRGIQKTPYEVWYGRKPDLGRLRIIGCDAWHHVPKETPGQKKLSARAIKYRLLGYEGRNQYRLWNPVARKVIVSRDVTFDESSALHLPNKQTHWDDENGREGTDLVDPHEGDLSEGDGSTTSTSIPPAALPAPGALHPARSTADLNALSSDSDDQHSEHFSDQGSMNNHPRLDQRNDGENDDFGPETRPDLTADATIPGRPMRTSRPAQKVLLNEFWGKSDNWATAAAALVVHGHISALTAASEGAYCRYAAVRKATVDDYAADFDPDMEFNHLCDAALTYAANKGSPLANLDDEPLTYKQAMAGSYQKQWKAAGDKEIADLKSMQTYIRVKRSRVPKGTKILTTRMVYKFKKDLHGKVQRYKARCVVRGFRQEEGIDFHETYAAVVKAMSFKTLFAIIAKRDLDCEQVDIVTAFLNSLLQEPTYVEPPEGYREEEYVWLLKRALYGLKQSPREWYNALKEFLESLGFHHINADHSVFVNRSKRLIVTAYVDDLLIVGPKGTAEIPKLKKELAVRFKMTDLGPCHHYLGMEITRDRGNRTLHLSQRTYIEKVLERFGMLQCKADVTPMSTSIHLVPETGNQTSKEAVTHYQSIIGSLMYAMVETRPDIAYAVSVLSRFCSNPNKTHEAAAKHVLRYLKGSLHIGITYGGNDDLIGYTDADWAGDQDTRRSTGGYLFTLYGGAISWSSKRQASVALSSCEAEYMAQTQATKEAIWIKRLIKELDLDGSLTAVHTRPVLINADNQGAIALSKDPKFHSRTKHIAIQWHFVREQVELKAVDLVYLQTDHMAADGLTKPLDRIKFARFLTMIGLTKD